MKNADLESAMLLDSVMYGVILLVVGVWAKELFVVLISISFIIMGMVWAAASRPKFRGRNHD